jgi:AbrB family looped-hinge helix DNA binding protein
MTKSESPGFSEDSATPFEGPPSAAQWRLKIGPEGRVVIPAAARAALELEANGTVLARLEDGELRLTSPKAALRKVQAVARKYKKPGASVVDELIAERRAAAAKGD